MLRDESAVVVLASTYPREQVLSGYLAVTTAGAGGAESGIVGKSLFKIRL